MTGLQYWKNMSEIFWDYLNHKEGKFDGEKGVLQRKHLVVSSVEVIGKESNELEEAEVFGLNDESYIRYENQIIDTSKILQITPKEAEKYGISKRQLYRTQDKVRNKTFRPRKKTIKKIANILKRAK
jgi:hypothetical protein